LLPCSGEQPTEEPLESGRVEEPHPRTTRKLADALEVDPSELVGGE
jgi:hypothetical protein